MKIVRVHTFVVDPNKEKLCVQVDEPIDGGECVASIRDFDAKKIKNSCQAVGDSVDSALNACVAKIEEIGIGNIRR